MLIAGPGDYDVKSSVSRCKNRLTNKYVPFNQTGKRVLNEVPLEDQLKPSPATYNMCKNLEENTPIYHSSFKCKVNRIIYAAKVRFFFFSIVIDVFGSSKRKSYPILSR